MAVARNATNSAAVVGPVAAARPRLGRPCSRPGRINKSTVVLAHRNRAGAAAFASVSGLQVLAGQTVLTAIFARYRLPSLVCAGACCFQGCCKFLNVAAYNNWR
jgi:hypothetical protein